MELRRAGLDSDAVGHARGETRAAEERQHFVLAEELDVRTVEQAFEGAGEMTLGEREDHREVRHVGDRGEQAAPRPQKRREAAHRLLGRRQVLDHIGGDDHVELGGQRWRDGGDVALNQLIAVGARRLGCDRIKLHPQYGTTPHAAQRRSEAAIGAPHIEHPGAPRDELEQPIPGAAGGRIEWAQVGVGRRLVGNAGI